MELSLGEQNWSRLEDAVEAGKVRCSEIVLERRKMISDIISAIANRPLEARK